MTKKTILLLLASIVPLLIGCSQSHQDPEVRPLYELCERLFPDQAKGFEFALMTENRDSDGSSRYTVESDGKVVHIHGTDRLALCVGLNRYLREACHTYVSPYASEEVKLPDALPSLPTPLEGTARVDERFYLNYCTFGYSMPYWKWSDWERFIDWMALNGVTMPLAITGQEKVWLNVWTELGMDPEEVKAYFTGPAHLPWHRMNNVDGWEGPLPDNWIDGQVELQKKILERERSFGMRPVLPAFAGHVPEKIKEYFPEEDILKLGKWGGYDDVYGTYYLSPSSPLFAKIQKLYLEKQTELFGTDHIYGIDAFNEVDAPDWSPEFLEQVASTIYTSLTNVDPEAKWLMMTWLFYYDKQNWTPERIEAFLKGVPQGSLYLLDYYCDKVEVWRETEGFHGQPYLWCYLGNFGENSWLCGNLGDVHKKINKALQSSTPPMGIGCTLEGLDVNPLMYEYVLAQAWSNAPTPSEWIDSWARSRGASDDNQKTLAGWETLGAKIYQDFSRGGQAVLIHGRPALHGYNGWVTVPEYEYENRYLAKAWSQLIDGYRTLSTDRYKSEMEYDLVNVGRQALGNLFIDYRDALTEAYEAKNLEQAKKCGAEMIELIDDYATLLTYADYFTLGKWLSDARDMADGDTDLANYYEHNARSIITVWGQPGRQLCDYANRAKAGLVKDYYQKRWQMFVDAITTALEQNKTLDEEAFKQEMVTFEENWRNSLGTIDETMPDIPLADFAQSLLDKYFDKTEYLD